MFWIHALLGIFKAAFFLASGTIVHTQTIHWHQAYLFIQAMQAHLFIHRQSTGTRHTFIHNPLASGTLVHTQTIHWSHSLASSTFVHTNRPIIENISETVDYFCSLFKHSTQEQSGFFKEIATQQIIYSNVTQNEVTLSWRTVFYDRWVWHRMKSASQVKSASQPSGVLW